jgi:acetyl esterase/lipase
MRALLRWLAATVALLTAGLGLLHFVNPPRAEHRMALIMPKLLAGALAPILALAGALAGAIGLVLGAPLTVLAGLSGAILSAVNVRGLLASHDGLERAFGQDWVSRLPPERRAALPAHRWTWLAPEPPAGCWQRNVVFATVPEGECGAGEKLLCDLWHPPQEVTPSGLAVIYLHGSGWHLLDKDVGTRYFFGSLAAQGHVVMDVAYRLCPDVDLDGMNGDVRRAIAWLKDHAAEHSVNPDRIVLCGGSAGGHLALLAAYTPGHPQLTPPDLAGRDLTVHGVISCYGVPDMCVYYHNGEHAFPPQPDRPERVRSGPLDKLMGQLMNAMLGEVLIRQSDKLTKMSNKWMMNNLLGGSPEQAPERYALASPVNHVSRDCPPTLLLHGTHDAVAPIEGSRALARRLQAAGVPVVFVEYPNTQHAFDLLVPRLAPVAQAAQYEVEHFLAALN